MAGYSQTWSTSHPGCLIFLLDQSASMSDPFGASQISEGRRKSDMVATILNGFLNELIVTNTVAKKDGSTSVRPRAEVAVIGYEGSFVGSAFAGMLQGKSFATLPELQMYPLSIEQRKKKEIDETGMVLEIAVQFPLWVRPIAAGGTLMCEALQHAQQLAWEWASAHPDSYPPVIINVSDGAATDGDPASQARLLTEVATNDGQALFFNIHITDINSTPVAYPTSDLELPNDHYAKKLFSISSIIPDTSRMQLQALIGRSIFPGARGMIFNGDAVSIRQMFVFASAPATKPLEDLDMYR